MYTPLSFVSLVIHAYLIIMFDYHRVILVDVFVVCCFNIIMLNKVLMFPSE